MSIRGATLREAGTRGRRARGEGGWAPCEPKAIRRRTLMDGFEKREALRSTKDDDLNERRGHERQSCG